jgi:ferredoxin
VSLGIVFEELASGPPVTIDVDRCLNGRHDQAGCRRCVDACPTDAIALAGHLPSLVIDSCVQCGACTPACPTDAVVGNDRPERRLVETSDALDAPAITLACSAHPHPAAFESGGVVVRHSRCLAAIGSEQLLATGHNGHRTVSLDLSWCCECPIGVAADVVIGNAEATNALVSLATGELVAPTVLRGLPGVDASPDAGRNAGARVVDSRRPATSRRGMFASLRRRAAVTIEYSKEPTRLPLRRARGSVPNRLPQTVPTSRRRLLDRLAKISAGFDVCASTLQVSASAASIADVRVDADRCSGCDMCARYCPTGALRFSTSDDHARNCFALVLRTSSCIDCGICAVACPEQAVSYGDEISTRSFIAAEWSTVASGPLVDCASCGLPTASIVDERCFSCRLGTGVVTALRDDAGLMADLLARTPTEPER